MRAAITPTGDRAHVSVVSVRLSKDDIGKIQTPPERLGIGSSTCVRIRVRQHLASAGTAATPFLREAPDAEAIAHEEPTNPGR